MFQGESDHTLDDKNRLIVPTRFREHIGTKFYLTKGYNGAYIWIFTVDEWNTFIDALDRRPQLDKQTMILKRYFTSTEVTPDSQWRIPVPPKLRQHAGIADHGEVVMVGVGSRIEIWSAAEWAKFNDDLTPEMIAEAAEAVGI